MSLQILTVPFASSDARGPPIGNSFALFGGRQESLKRSHSFSGYFPHCIVGSESEAACTIHQAIIPTRHQPWILVQLCSLGFSFKSSQANARTTFTKITEGRMPTNSTEECFDLLFQCQKKPTSNFWYLYISSVLFGLKSLYFVVFILYVGVSLCATRRAHRRPFIKQLAVSLQFLALQS